MLPRTYAGTLTATTLDATMIDLTGGVMHGSVGFTKDQIKRLSKVYGFTTVTDKNDLEQAGGQRNLMRHVEVDGMRAMAFLSRYLEKGEDPVRFLQNAMVDVGYDVPDLMEDEEDQDDAT